MFCFFLFSLYILSLLQIAMLLRYITIVIQCVISCMSCIYLVIVTLDGIYSFSIMLFFNHWKSSNFYYLQRRLGIDGKEWLFKNPRGSEIVIPKDVILVQPIHNLHKKLQVFKESQSFKLGIQSKAGRSVGRSSQSIVSWPSRHHCNPPCRVEHWVLFGRNGSWSRPIRHKHISI